MAAVEGEAGQGQRTEAVPEGGVGVRGGGRGDEVACCDTFPRTLPKQGRRSTKTLSLGTM